MRLVKIICATAVVVAVSFSASAKADIYLNDYNNGNPFNWANGPDGSGKAGDYLFPCSHDPLPGAPKAGPVTWFGEQGHDGQDGKGPQCDINPCDPCKSYDCKPSAS